MPVIRLNFTAEELNILKNHAGNKDLSTTIKEIALKYISDEGKCDKHEFAEYEREETNGVVKTYSHEEA